VIGGNLVWWDVIFWRCCIIIAENGVVNITHLEKTYIAATGVVFFR
jgi:hypothetical protein